MLLALLIRIMLALAHPQQPVNIFLTFDDGPGPGTRQVYSLADSEQVKINAFIIGNRAVAMDSIGILFQNFRQDSLILFANHSFSHAEGHYRKYYEDPAAVVKDFDRNRDALHLEKNFARMPGRNYWRISGRREVDVVNGREAADSLTAGGYDIVAPHPFQNDLYTKQYCHSFP
jgi:peptidoglycan/xylan/chitin deacetylase (PgdA/CDA1 family)